MIQKASLEKIRHYANTVAGLKKTVAFMRRCSNGLRQAYRKKKLKKLVEEITPLSLERIRRGALEFAANLRHSSSGQQQYVYKSGAPKPILYASIYALLIRHLLGELRNMSTTQKDNWASYINSYQGADGMYRDPVIANTIAESEDWWGWRHLTLHALMALSALGSKPRYYLEFVSLIDTASKARNWLSSLDWGARTSFTSNTVQNFCAAMQYARDFQGADHLEAPVKEILAGLRERCCPATGLWGNGIDDPRAALSEGVQAGYHFWLLFWYDRMDVPFPEKAFDSILRLQNRLGGFGLTHVNTSACQDIDGLDPLVRLAFSLKKEEQIHATVRRSLEWIASNFNDDGGAVFQRYASFVYGHELMSSKPNESTLFSTWFRLLSIAIGCQLVKTVDPTFAGIHWDFVEAPGLQFDPLRHLGKKEEK